MSAAPGVSGTGRSGTTALSALKLFWPAPVAVDARERLRMVVGAGLGIGITALFCHLLSPWVLDQFGFKVPLTWIIAPMGASAVLVFCVPASPLAQPWSVVGGNTVSALAAVVCVHWIAPVDLAAACAVALAIAAMLALRCLHPPGGATALLLALGSVGDARAALFPVLANSLLLTLCGIAYNNATRRPYPHKPVAPPAAAGATTEQDLDAVLAAYNQVLDVSREDLRTLLSQTQIHSHERRLANTCCADIMSRDPKTVEFGTPLQDAWALLRQHDIKALPVVDKWMRIVGILTLADFLKDADFDLHEGAGERLRGFIRSATTTHSDKPEVVGQIMTRRVRVASAQRPLADLVLLFGSTRHKHIPVIGEGEKLVGLVTQSDLVAALASHPQSVSS